MSKLINLIGQKFGRLTPVKQMGISKHKKSLWLCKCDCGNEIVVLSNSLRTGGSKSCGCLNKELIFKRNWIHGHNIRNKISKMYLKWREINKRCCDHNSKEYIRGVKVCYRWSNKNPRGFQNFYKDVGESPKGKSLGLINSYQDYSPKNYGLITSKEQARNRIDNAKIKLNGKIVLLIDLAKKYKIPLEVLRGRLRHEWPLKMALMTPVRKRKSLLIKDYDHQLRASLWNLRLKKVNISKDLPYNSKQLRDHLENIKM